MFSKTAKSIARRTLRRFGFDLTRFDQTHPLARRIRLLKCYGIDVVIDVGANEGQYALALRELGFTGRILSFEPSALAFEALHQQQVRRPAGWSIRQLAIGDQRGLATLHVSANSYSSSLLAMLPAHLASAPESRIVGQERVRVETLDTIIRDEIEPSARIFVKSDTQGFDARVIDGAGRSLERVVGIQVEMSIVPLYDGETLFSGMFDSLSKRGFTLMSIEPGFADRETGRLLQFDAVLFREVGNHPSLQSDGGP